MKQILFFIAVLSLNVLSFGQTSVYNFSGMEFTYTVPAGVKLLEVDVVGGAGGHGSGSSGTGGNGARVQANIFVSAGEVYAVSVGEDGQKDWGSTGNFYIYGGGGLGGYVFVDDIYEITNYGGHGGGCSYIKLNGETLPMVVAGGGGGGSVNAWGDSFTNSSGGLAGHGGYAGHINQDGSSWSNNNEYGKANGSGGTAWCWPGNNGEDGSSYSGGYGRNNGCGLNPSYGGGGGGGYPHGGGGGTGDAGGAGGKSYTYPSQNKINNVVHTSGFNSGYGYISITAHEGTYIPDDNFEAYLESIGMGDGFANNNYVKTSNINSIETLNVSGLGIADLTGIEDFTSLTSLDCSNNLLTNLDVSNNTNLNDFNSTGNINLFCVDVDDVVYADANYIQIDSQTGFSLNCITALGCTNSNAINYNSSASVDDGSCIYASCPGDNPENGSYCYGDNEDTYFYYVSETEGVPISLMINSGTTEIGADDVIIYDGPNSSSTVLNAGLTQGNLSDAFMQSTGDYLTVRFNSDQSGSCQSGSFTSFDWDVYCGETVVYGCTDSSALNYNSLANVNDGSCICNDDSPENNSYCYSDNDDTYFYYLAETPGTPITLSINSGATEANVDHVYIYDGPDDTGYLLNSENTSGNLSNTTVQSSGYYLTIRFTSDWSGACQTGHYNPIIWDVNCGTPIVQGCTDNNYLEYNPLANVNDGSCSVLVVNGCTDSTALNYNSNANVDDESCIIISCPGDNPEGGSYCYGDNDDTYFYYVSETPGTPISLMINSGATELNNDGVYIYDGLDYTGALLNSNNTSGDLSSAFMQSTGDYLTIRFNSDQSGSCQSGSFTSFDWDIYCGETVVYGCTDSSALNYNSLANINDGSCICNDDSPENNSYCYGDNDDTYFYYVSETPGAPISLSINSGTTEANVDHIYIYDGLHSSSTMLNTGLTQGDLAGYSVQSTGDYLTIRFASDQSGSCQGGHYSAMDWDVYCGESVVYGCTDDNYLEYDSLANVDDGSCSVLVVYGCTDSTALNYNSNANVDDESCITVACSGDNPEGGSYCYADNEDTYFYYVAETPGIPISIYINSGETEPGADGMYIYDGLDYTGALLNSGANSGNNIEGSFYQSTGDYLTVRFNSDWSGSCQGGHYSAIDWDIYCGESVVYGCIDNNYLEYNPLANINDGSCSVLIVNGCADSTALNYNSNANVDDESCIMISCPGDNPEGGSYCYGDNDDTYFYYVSETPGTPISLMINSGATELNNDGVYIYDGLDYTGALLNSNNTSGDLSSTFMQGTGDYLTIRFTSDQSGSCQGGHYSAIDWDIYCGESVVYGCTDSTMFNYDSNANTDDGSCIAIVNGCMDSTACNYDANANTSDSSCTYALTYYDCDGNCIADADGDGVCDELEIAGCMDNLAFNYDIEATDSDDSCLYPSVTISGITEGQVFSTTAVSASISISDFTVALGVGDGHIHYSIDGQMVMQYDLSDISISLEEGLHTLIVELVDNSHQSFSPIISDTVSFEVLLPVSGCTDESATNFNAEATESCVDCCEYAVCVNPSTVWVEDVVHTRARIKWDNVNADRYLIKFNGASTTGPSTGNAVGDGLEAGTGKLKYFLDAETEYTVSMRTFCFDGTKSDWEDVVVFTTLAECNNPTVLGTDWIEAEYVGMSWEHGDNANGASKYIGQMREVGSSSWSTFASSEMLSSSNPGVDQPTAYKEKAGLTTGATYEYQVKTWCNTGDANNPTDPYYRASGFGPALGTFTTVPCLAQTENLGVSYNSTNANGASHAFSWDVNTDDVAPADRYIIQFTVAGAGNWQNRTVSGGGTATGRNIGGFTVGTEYAWRVRTYCSESPSARWRSDWVYGPNFVAGDGARLAHAPVLNLDVYPNPSRDVFNVTFASEEVQNINVKITNVLGEEVYQETLQDFIGQYTKSIDLRKESKGVYTLQISTEKGGVNKKMVLQ